MIGWLLIHECESGSGTDGGRGSHRDSPRRAGLYNYRLRAWVLDDQYEPPQQGGGRLAWSEPVRVLLEAPGGNRLGNIMLSPNPWDGEKDLILRLDNPLPVDGRLQLINVEGRVVSEIAWPAEAVTMSFRLPKGLRPATGAHFVRLQPVCRGSAPGAALLLIR